MSIISTTKRRGFLRWRGKVEVPSITFSLPVLKSSFPGPDPEPSGLKDKMETVPRRQWNPFTGGKRPGIDIFLLLSFYGDSETDSDDQILKSLFKTPEHTRYLWPISTPTNFLDGVISRYYSLLINFDFSTSRVVTPQKTTDTFQGWVCVRVRRPDGNQPKHEVYIFRQTPLRLTLDRSEKVPSVLSQN